MRWFRSHKVGVVGLACFALACQLMLSFGHVHLGKLVSNTSLLSVLAGDDAKGATPSSPAHQAPTGLADGYCAICGNIGLASTLIVPAAPAIKAPISDLERLPWAVAETEPAAFEHFRLRARGPPQA
jgi:hypothetical protein